MNPMLKVLPPIWFFILLIVGLAAHYFVPASRVFTYPYPIAGGVLFIAGFVYSMYASALFSKEKTEILPTSATNAKLVTYGPYKYSRNPMYLGILLQLVGVAIWVGTLPVFVSALVYFCVMNFVFVPFEEAKLARIFGASYEEYKNNVRRWI